MKDVEEKFRIISFKVHEKRISDVWEILKDHNLEMILIKGWTAAQNYPKPYSKTVGDIDIAVNPSNIKKP